MFLRLTVPRLGILCLDGLIDQGVLSAEMRQTIESACQLDELIVVSYRVKKEAEEWLGLNPIARPIREIICRPGAWSVPPIAEALAQSGRKACETVAVCADGFEVSEAHAQGAGAILLTRVEGDFVPHEPPFTVGPDFILQAGDDGASLFSTEKRYAGYLGELLAADGSFPPIAAKEVVAYSLIFENPEAAEAPVHVCGRYFSTGDARYKLHPLSLRLINAKNAPERQADLVASTLTHWRQIYSNEDAVFAPIPSRIPSVPNLASLGISRLQNTRTAPGLLACTRDYPKQKEAGSYDSRRVNVEGVFRVTAEIKGASVVVVDDITTSFATLNEARQTLLDAGATTVIPLALSFHPDLLAIGPDVEYPRCSECRGPMVVRFRTTNGKPFFACSDLEAFREGARHPLRNFRDVYALQASR